MVLELSSVAKTFPGPPPVQVLRAVSFRACSGETLAVTGPSGSGKSTLLNLLGCLDTPTGGRLLLDGHDLALLSERERAAYRASTVGFVFQMHHLLPQCTVLENVLLPISAVPGLPKEERRRRADRGRELLARVGLEGRAAAYPGTLSGGECQRAAVARALANEPALLLADEPTGSLDASAAAAVADLLFSLAGERGVLLVVATHAPELAARAARRLGLAAGAIA